MTKAELRDKIRAVVQQVYKSKSAPVDLDAPSPISLGPVKFPVLAKFPDLQKVIKNLLTSQYEIFLSDIEWVAPRPTTFRIILQNDEMFYLIFTERSWIAQVEGKKYYLLNLNEEESAAEAISRLLYFASAKPAKNENMPAEETGEELPAAEEPAAEEEAIPEPAS
jgi:hypothetical protein